MEEIEYLEEYEDLILPMSFAVDDGKCNERLDGRKSIDSLEMLYKDLIEDTSLQQNQPDTSPFSLNPHMISPEKTILSSSTTVEIGLAQSFPNYSLNATPPAYVNATATDTLHAYQAQTPNIQYLNRATNKSFSSYSSLQKPDKLKSVATVKPTLQRVNNPPKQYIQRESPIFKTIIPGQPAPQSQHIFTKPSSTKTTFAVGSSSIVSKSKSALKISKLSAAGVDPLAGLDDDVLLDFDERNGLVDGFDFESDLDNSIIAGLSDMDSESVDLSDEFIDDNFDLESDLSSEGSDLKKILKRKRSQLSSQDSLERQNTKSVNDLKRDASNSVKKKLSLNNKHGSEGYNEKLPSTSSSVGRDPSIVVYSTKVNEVVANGNIFPHLSSKLNDLEQAHVSNVLNLTPTVPLYTKEGDKTESGLKQFVALTPTPNEKNNHQKKDERTHAIIDPFRGFPESFTSKPEEKQTGEVVKSNLNDLNLNKSPLKNTETSNQKDAPSDKPARLKFGSLYLRAIKPPSLKPSPIKTATIVLQQTNPCKTPTTSQPPKVTEESCKTAQKNISLTTATQNIVSNCPAINTVADVSKTLKALPSTPDATKIPEKWSSVPKILESKDKNPEPTENVRVMPQLKRHKSLGALNASLPGRESANIKNKDSSEKPKAHAQSRAQKIVNIIHESNSKKETTLPQTHEGKKRDSITKPNVQIQSIKSSLSGAKAAQGAKKDDLSNVSKAQTQLKQKVHAEERITLKSEKTNTNVKTQDISDVSKGQGQVKQKVNAEEKITSNAEKVNTVIKTQEHRDRFANEKSKVPSPPKLKCMDEKITAALEKSSTPNAHEVRVHDVSDKSEVQAQIRRRRFAVQRNRSKSANRTVDIQAPAADSKEINEKQLKAAQQSVEHKRLDAISTQSGDTHLRTEKMLLDKEPSLQQSHEASLENKITALVDEMPLPTKRRKVLESRKFNGRNSKRKESMNSPHAADPPSVQPTAEIAEKSKSEREAHKSVILPQANGTATVPQALQKDIPQKVPTSTPSSSRQTSKLSSNAKSESKLALLNLGPLKPLSSRKAISREQKKINLRQFKIRLNRKTVDHFMKSIKDVVSSTPTDTKNSDLNEFKSPLSVVGISKLVIPRSAGRPRKNFPTCLRSPHQNAEEKVVHSEPQAPVVSSLVPLPKLTQNEPEVEKNVSLEVQSCPTLKRRKRKKMRSNLPAKILRSDKTSSTDKSDISNKDCITDPVPQKEQCLADGSTHNNKATPAETLIPAVPAEATNLPVPKETSNSGEPASVIKPITSSVLQQCTTSPTVPTLANSPTFPTDAASPAMSTGNNSLKVVKAPSSESVPTKTAETGTSPNHLKKRGRPYSKKNARRAAFARRLELIRASTSQRLPITPTPEEPTAKPAAVGKDNRLVNENIMIETNATASPDNSELSAQTIETAPSAASRTPIHSKKTKSLAASQTSVQVNDTTSPSTPQSKKSKSLATSQTCPQTDATASQTSVHSKKTKSSSVSQPSDQINETASPAAPQTPVQTNKTTSSNVQSKKTKSSQACVQTVEISSPSTFQSPLQTKKTPSSAASQPSVPVLETTSSAMSPPLPQPKSVTCQPPGPANETDSLATPQPSIQTQESATTEPLVQTKETTSLASQTPDGLHLTNLVQPKTEIGDPTSPNQAPDLGTTMFDGAPAVYSFARPRDTCRNSELFLDACQIAANSFATEQNGATESVAIFDLPSYIVMRTRIITRGELQKTGSAIPPQIKINKSPENGHAAPVFKEESPDFKDICLEINTLLGRNANYLKFASASERQARMNQVLSDSSLSVQEAESALKFLQSYLSARSKDVSVNNAKGQQFIPIYDSQKKVIGYRKRRVHPKKSPPSMEVTKKSGRLLIRSSNSSRSRTTSTICTTPVQQIVVEFSTKEEPQTIDAGDEELIVPDVSSVSTNAIKSEIES